MKIYKIPFDVKHEEKIFGGYLSLRQVVYLLLMICSIGIFFFNIHLYIKFILFSVLSLTFVSFAFIRIQETRIDKYLIYFIKYLMRKKIYMFER